jgi:hypothetical protein
MTGVAFPVDDGGSLAEADVIRRSRADRLRALAGF